MQLFVSIEGDDSNPGTLEKPFATLHQAQQRIREIKQKGVQTPIDVFVRAGTYEFAKPLILEPEDSGSVHQPIRYSAFPGERVVLSGGKRLNLAWKPYRDGIWFAQVNKDGTESVCFDQLFVNRERQIRARYPNYCKTDSLMDGPGYIQAMGGMNRLPDQELIFDPKTFSQKHWSNPATGIVHAFQSHYWGNMQYRIKDIDWERHILQLGDGGFQLQRSYGINHKSRFYIENIFEELDAPGEWFLDEARGILYYYPPDGLDLKNAEVIAGVLGQLVKFRGSVYNPVSHITLAGFTFTHTQTTFMAEYEPLARGDWAIHRGGAVFMEGAADCAIQDCFFDSVGGNGVFLSGYNRRNTIDSCKFERAGESGICVVGSSSAVRMYQTWGDMESGRTPEPDDGAGPKSEEYPQDCVISNNIIHDIGIYGKQTAGIFISMSKRITASRNTIYEVPRAAICINDGTWGGHVIEYNDIWETVRETGEHGPFNSWGRERQWSPQPRNMRKEAVHWDAQEAVVIRCNRIANFRKSVSAGNWTIDLDDGSSNYHIYNNLSLGSTLKLRDGYYRKVENNIFVSPVPLGWHVWPRESEDVFVRNIVVISGSRPGESEPTGATYGPIGMPEHPWGRMTDYNLYWNLNIRKFLVKERPSGREYSWEQWRSLGYDPHSRQGNPLFFDPTAGDYRVKEESPALGLGFINFPMDQFGHRQTRICPFGGEFERTIAVTLRPDNRGGEVWYTTDGSEPYPGSAGSRRYEGPLELDGYTVLKAATYHKNVAWGFTQTAVFTKVTRVSHPDWLDKLLNADTALQMGNSPKGKLVKSESFTWLGAVLADILEGDLIDALGGHNEGVLLAEVPESSHAYGIGLRKYDVLVQYNGVHLRNIWDFKELMPDEVSTSAEIWFLRGYDKLKTSLNPLTGMPHRGYTF